MEAVPAPPAMQLGHRAPAPAGTEVLRAGFGSSLSTCTIPVWTADGVQGEPHGSRPCRH